MTTLLDALRAKSALIGDANGIDHLEGDTPHSPGKPRHTTAKYPLQLASGARAFLIVSGEGNPGLAARAARNIAAIRARLTPATAAPIVEPLEAGEAMGRSYTLWPMLRPWPEGRIARYLAKRRNEGPILNWLLSLMRETHEPMDATRRQKALHYLALLEGDTWHPDQVRSKAADAAGHIEKGNWSPISCVQHSDLWLGNIMRPPRGAAATFSVIDWPGARLDGYPFFDMCRFAISCGTSQARIRRAAAAGLRECDPASRRLTPYVLCALGQIQDNLEHFPETMFRAMLCETAAFSMKIDEGLA